MSGRLRDERGFTLVLTLAALLVLSLTAAAVVTATAVNHRSSLRSSQAEKAFALAQQGLAYAEGRLYTSPQTASSVLVPGTTIAPTDDVGTIHYSGTLCTPTTTPSCDPKVWTLYGTGTVDGVARTVSAQVTIPQVTTTYSTTTPVVTSDASMWNYVYVDGGGGCTSISGNLTFNVPLYTHGCLYLSGNVKFTGSDLEVGGALSVSGSAKIGSSGAPISRLNVAGACTPAPCDGSHDPIWVNVPGVGNTLTPTIAKPTVDLAGSYASANPGPTNPCPTGSNVPANFFDNDAALNRSDGSANLFPSGKPYDCKVGSNELRWDGAGNLYVDGTFYFDGDLTMNAGTHVVYSGKGTIYFTGTIALSGNANLCGVSGCSAAGWQPDTNALVLVAGCRSSSGGTIASGCVSISGGFVLQAGIYSNTDYSISGTAVNMGPVVASSGSFSGNVTQMIPFRDPPAGAPANTTTTTVTTTTTTTTDGNPSSPGNWSG
jgi:Tfp pilus assembly protein PilX